MFVYFFCLNILNPIYVYPIFSTYTTHWLEIGLKNQPANLFFENLKVSVKVSLSVSISAETQNWSFGRSLNKTIDKIDMEEIQLMELNSVKGSSQ